MKCPFCGAEIEDGLPLCPMCQKDLTENLTETEALAEEAADAAEEATEETAEEATDSGEKATEEAEEIGASMSEWQSSLAGQPEKSKKKSSVIPIILCGLAACAIVALILFGPKLIGMLKKGSVPATDPDSDGGKLTDVTAYAVDDVESADDARMQQIVVKCGDTTMTNSDLQILYRIEYQNFMQYAPYYAMYGMETPDESIPMSEQVRTEDSLTWEQYFLSTALDYANELAAACEESHKNGYELDDAAQQMLDTLPETMDKDAESGGYASTLEYVQEGYGKGVSVESFVHFFEMYLYANAYEQYVYGNLTCTEDEVNAFFDQNPDVMAANGVSKESADVRHILIAPADADEDGESTEEEWTAAEAEAQRIYDLFMEDPTEENFITLATENTDDPGFAENGGLYEGVTPGQMVTEFNDWIFDTSRVAGDCEIVKTKYGYHVMYFISAGENADWYSSCEELCKNEKMTQTVQKMVEDNPIKVWYNAIVLDNVQKAAPAEDTQTTVQTETVG